MKLFPNNALPDSKLSLKRACHNHMKPDSLHHGQFLWEFHILVENYKTSTSQNDSQVARALHF